MSNNKKLRCITYLSPDIPVETFEAFVQYIEQVTGCETYLIYESRSKGPPEDKVDPFTSDEVDIGKVETGSLLTDNAVLCLQRIVNMSIFLQ